MVDFEKGRDLRLWIMEHTGGPAAGGLTVRDVMATTAMGALMENSYISDKDAETVAKLAYEFADAMLAARITLPPQPQPTVEEAFGFEKPQPGSWVEIQK